MTTEHGHHAAPTAAAPFTEAEIRTFHADDRKQAGIIIVLITSIFVIGVVIYTIVATAVDLNPHR
jgi:uncharacterized membrane protein